MSTNDVATSAPLVDLAAMVVPPTVICRGFIAVTRTRTTADRREVPDRRGLAGRRRLARQVCYGVEMVFTDGADRAVEFTDFSLSS